MERDATEPTPETLDAETRTIAGEAVQRALEARIAGRDVNWEVPGVASGDVTPLQASFGTTLGALLVTAVYAAPELAATPLAALPARVWWVLLYLSVVTTAGTLFLLQYASTRLPGSKVMAYTYLVPSWVVLWEVLAHANLPSPALLGGILATMLALVMLLKVEARG